jgi:hypothetical protein
MKMKRAILTVMTAAWIMAQSVMGLPVSSDNYIGTVSYDTGIYATPNWNNEGTWLNWNITQLEQDLWRYEYTWSTDGRDLSHIIIGVTEGAALDDFWNWSYNYQVESSSPQVGWFGPGPGNPGMPDDLYGLKLDLAQDTPVFQFSFETWRSPVWGDFYAKDGRYQGGDVYAHNVGFGTPGNDQGLHIAVPNGLQPPTIILIPDGGLTLGLIGFALLGLGFVRRRLVS